MKKILVLFKNRNWLKYIAQTRTSVKLLVVFTILACGPMPLDSNEFFSLFYPENAKNTDKNSAFIFSIGYVSEHYTTNYNDGENELNESYDEKLNLDAWENYLKNKIDRKTLKNGLYEKGNLESLGEKVKSLDYSAGIYLKFCGKVDSKIQFNSGYWDDKKTFDTLGLTVLYNEAKENSKLAKNDFLKERYHYQYVKIGRSINRDAEILKTQAQLSKNYASKTYISEWTQSNLAGSKMILGDTAAAVYDFSKIYYNAPSRRKEAERSIRYISDKNFEKAQKLSKNPKETANILCLWAVQKHTDGIDLIEKIYDLDPNNELLELVFTREINKNENTFFAEKNSWNYYGGGEYYDENYKIDDTKIKKAKQKAESYLEKLLSFSEKVSSEKKVKSTNFWKLSNAYFYFLKNDLDKSKKTLTNIDTTGYKYLKHQVDFLTFETTDKTVNTENEANHLSLISTFLIEDGFRTNNMKVKMAETLYNFYIQKPVEQSSDWGWFRSCTSKKKIGQGDFVKGFLALNIGATKSGDYGFEINKNQDFYTDTCSVAFLENVLSFLNKPYHNSLEKKLIEYSNIKPQYLLLALVRKQIIAEDYNLAYKNLQKISPEFLSQNGFDSYFDAYPKDILMSKSLNSETSPLEYLKKLSLLKTKTKNGNAEDWYDYGVARYNLSYYGQGWLFSKRSKSHYELVYPESENTLIEEYYTTNITLECFKKANSLKPNPELAAKICYGGALCERNQYWVKFNQERPENYNEEEAYIAKMSSKVLPKYRTFFKELREKYSNTQYHKMLLEECSTFANYTP